MFIERAKMIDVLHSLRPLHDIEKNSKRVPPP